MNLDDDDDTVDPEEEVPTSTGGEARFAAVDVKSGEERYNLLLTLTCKLLRFDEGENKWKERGQGEVKILESKNAAKTHTLLVRREIIGKIAAQHALGPGLTLKPHPKSEKSFIWSTPADLSDDPAGIPETFLIVFPTEDAAQQFKLVFNTVTASR